MKCSSCGLPIKAAIAVDLDGTLGRYHEHFTWFASEWMGQDLPRHYTGLGPFWKYLGLELPLYREIKLAYRQGGLKRSIPLYPGAQEFMSELRLLNLEIWIASTRPYLRLDNIDPDTRAWLDRNQIAWDFMIYGDDKYQQLINLVDRRRIVGAVDDLRELCVEAEKLDLSVWQVSREHNMDDDFHKEAVPLPTILEGIKLEFRTWREANQ